MKYLEKPDGFDKVHDQDKLIVSVKEAAAQLGVGQNATYNLVRCGRLRAITLGKRLLIPRSELQAFIERELAGGVE